MNSHRFLQGNACLLLNAALATTFVSFQFVAPSLAQGDVFTNVPQAEHIWQPSNLGGFYDATGKIQGTVPLKDLPLYGGRFADGTPVDGSPKLRDAEGNLINTQQYCLEQKIQRRRLSQLMNMRDNACNSPDGSWERANADNEIAAMQAQQQSNSYPPMPPYANAPGYPPSLASNLPYAVPPSENSPYGYPPSDSSPSYRSMLLQQGLGLLKSRFGI